MRRIPRTPAGENPVKQKQQELTRSVNQEQTRLELIKKDCEVAVVDLEGILEKRDGAAKDLEGTLQQIDSARSDLVVLEQKKSNVVQSIKQSQDDLAVATTALATARQEAKLAGHKAVEDTERMVVAAESKVDSLKKSISEQQSALDNLSYESGLKKIELDRSIKDAQNESVVLRKLKQQAADCRRDLSNLEGTISKQESLLNDVQERVRQVQYQEYELKSKVEWQQKVLRDIDASIDEKKKEESGLSGRILAITRKEDKLRDLAQRVKVLYEKSGVKIDLEI